MVRGLSGFAANRRERNRTRGAVAKATAARSRLGITSKQCGVTPVHRTARRPHADPEGGPHVERSDPRSAAAAAPEGVARRRAGESEGAAPPQVSAAN
jgi:hypothetical protein